MNNANGEAFIINNCLLSDTLTLLSADVNTKGSLWAVTEGRWGQDTARRLGRDGWPGPESPQIVMKVGLTQGTVETEHLQEELQWGKKLLNFKLIETGPDFLL